MIQLKKAVTSAVGQKFLMALSGIGLVLFIIVHLLGNLTLYKSDGSTFNVYANTLDSYGLLLTVAEVGLLAVFLLHIVTAILVTRRNRTARPIGYRTWRSKSNQSSQSNEANPSNISSRNMIISGLIILGFLILHIYQFRFGPGIEQGYVTQVQGHQMVDLYRLVREVFSNPLYVGIYIVSMILLGTHLRHGFWSMFQSLGMMKARASRQVYCISFLIAFVLSLGFLLIPVWMYFGVARGGVLQ